MSKSDDKFWEIIYQNGMIGGADLDDYPTPHPQINQKMTDEEVAEINAEISNYFYFKQKMDVYNKWQMEISDLPDDWSIADFFEGEDE